jgi:NADH-quinone oxidoreductase subunit C
MNNKTLIEFLNEKFAQKIISFDELSDMLTVVVDPKIIHDLVLFLKESPALQFNFLTTLCGIHYPDRPLQFGIVYHLHNLYKNTRIRIKTFVSEVNPSVETITDLFSAANWMERETYDFYGILFEGHPNLKRILNVDYMDYFPMRKEYPLEDSTREDKDDRFFGR